MAIYVGIDPGVVNTGLCVLGIENEEVKACYSTVFNPSKYENVILAAEDFYNTFLISDVIDLVTIERYVSYKGVLSSTTEAVLMYIGALCSNLNNNKVSYSLTRAVDWKIQLSKHLFKTTDFKNPSTKLDKKFSLAAAEKITNTKFKTNHEADAACLAYMGYLNGRNRKITIL